MPAHAQVTQTVGRDPRFPDGAGRICKMRTRKYITDPKEVYTLELNKLQRCFSEVSRLGEEVSELSKIGWRQVEYLRHLNWTLQEAIQVAQVLTGAKIIL
jgi:hypothetical protein